MGLKAEYVLGVLGCTAIERALLTSVCRLSQVRNAKSHSEALPHYRVAELYNDHAVDIYIADEREKDTLSSDWLSQLNGTANPVIWLCPSAAPLSDDFSSYYLNRNKLGTVLRVLDEIVATHFSAPAKADHEALPHHTCLVIDDSRLVRSQMELLLDEYDLASEFAEDAESGLLLAKQKHYELIFLDVMLPEMDGYKACKFLKSDKGTKNTPVVMLTSKSSPFNRMHGALVGCDRYLTKPVDPDKVEKVLRHYGLVANSVPKVAY